MVVAQLVEQSLLAPEIRGSNPAISKNLSTNYTIEETKIKRKKPGMAHLLMSKHCYSKRSSLTFQTDFRLCRDSWRRDCWWDFRRSWGWSPRTRPPAANWSSDRDRPVLAAAAGRDAQGSSAASSLRPLVPCKPNMIAKWWRHILWRCFLATQ